MDARKLWVVVGLLAATRAALPARAQRRGTVEVGAFANAMDYDRDLHIREGIGAGARVGVFVARNWSAEVEGTGEVMPGPRHWNTGLRLGLSLFESGR